MQQADRIGLGVVGAEGIGADELGEAVGLVRIGAAHRAHLVQDDRHAGLGRLPGGFRAGEAAADDVDGLRVHGRRNNALTPCNAIADDPRRCGEPSGAVTAAGCTGRMRESLRRSRPCHSSLPLGASHGASAAVAVDAAEAHHDLPRLWLQLPLEAGARRRRRRAIPARSCGAGAGSPEAERAAISQGCPVFRAAVLSGHRRARQAEGGFRRVAHKGPDGLRRRIDQHARAAALSRRARTAEVPQGRAQCLSRGFFVDGRYPHLTAIVSDPGGTKWVVDSWYAPTGGAPDIFPYEQWKVRGQF